VQKLYKTASLLAAELWPTAASNIDSAKRTYRNLPVYMLASMAIKLTECGIVPWGWEPGALPFTPAAAACARGLNSLLVGVFHSEIMKMGPRPVMRLQTTIRKSAAVE
jgi:hypothetical protein